MTRVDTGDKVTVRGVTGTVVEVWTVGKGAEAAKVVTWTDETGRKSVTEANQVTVTRKAVCNWPSMMPRTAV